MSAAAERIVCAIDTADLDEAAEKIRVSKTLDLAASCSSDNSVQRSRAQTALALAPHLAMPAPSAPPARTREIALHVWRPSVESCRCSRAMALSKITRSPDVLVVGGGNAALCAAISAREAGASVLLLERAPKPHWGGNSRHTRNFRCMHACPLRQLTDAYGEDE